MASQPLVTGERVVADANKKRSRNSYMLANIGSSRYPWQLLAMVCMRHPSILG